MKMNHYVKNCCLKLTTNARRRQAFVDFNVAVVSFVTVITYTRVFVNVIDACSYK